MIKYLYICDGRVPSCSKRGSCYRNPLNTNGECFHTFDEKHALNGKLKPNDINRKFSTTYTENDMIFYELGGKPV